MENTHKTDTSSSAGISPASENGVEFSLSYASESDTVIADERADDLTAEEAEILDTPPREDEYNSEAEVSNTEREEDVTERDAEEEEEDNAPKATLDSDLETLAKEFPDIASRLAHGFVNTERYAKLRSLGLTPEEAYLATSRPARSDNRSHLTSSVPASAKSPLGGMSKREMATARYLFEDLSEREIKALYNRVTKTR